MGVWGFVNFRLMTQLPVAPPTWIDKVFTCGGLSEMGQAAVVRVQSELFIQYFFTSCRRDRGHGLRQPSPLSEYRR